MVFLIKVINPSSLFSRKSLSTCACDLQRAAACLWTCPEACQKPIRFAKMFFFQHHRDEMKKDPASRKGRPRWPVLLGNGFSSWFWLTFPLSKTSLDFPHSLLRIVNQKTEKVQAFYLDECSINCFLDMWHPLIWKYRFSTQTCVRRRASPKIVSFSSALGPFKALWWRSVRVGNSKRLLNWNAICGEWFFTNPGMDWSKRILETGASECSSYSLSQSLTATQRLGFSS